MTIIPIVIGIFSTVTKVLLKGLDDLEVEEQVETIQTKALLRTARILRRVLETWGDLLSIRIQWKTISKADLKNSQGVNNNNYNNQVTIIPNVIGTFGTVTKGLFKGLKDLEVGGRVETTNLLEYWERSEYWEVSW